jgi:hypothetical protein
VPLKFCMWWYMPPTRKQQPADDQCAGCSIINQGVCCYRCSGTSQDICCLEWVGGVSEVQL